MSQKDKLFIIEKFYDELIYLEESSNNTLNIDNYNNALEKTVKYLTEYYQDNIKLEFINYLAKKNFSLNLLKLHSKLHKLNDIKMILPEMKDYSIYIHCPKMYRKYRESREMLDSPNRNGGKIKKRSVKRKPKRKQTRTLKRKTNKKIK